MDVNWLDYILNFCNTDCVNFSKYSNAHINLNYVAVTDLRNDKTHAISHLSEVTIHDKAGLPWLDKVCNTLMHFYHLGIRVRLSIDNTDSILTKNDYIFKYLRGKCSNNVTWHLSEVTRTKLIFTIVDNSGLFRPFPVLRYLDSKRTQGSLRTVILSFVPWGYRIYKSPDISIYQRFRTYVEEGAVLKTRGFDIVF